MRVIEQEAKMNILNHKNSINGEILWWSTGYGSALSLPGPRYDPWWRN